MAFYFVFFGFYKYYIPLGLREINPDRDDIFIDILLKPLNKVPLGMIYYILVYSKIRTIKSIINKKTIN